LLICELKTNDQINHVTTWLTVGDFL